MIHTFKPGTEGDIRCLHGLRAVSMFWVILGHCTVFLPEINNVHEIAIKGGMAVVRLFYGATFGVESFFLLSGCLVSYLFLHTSKKLGGLRPGHMVQYYTHRYIRLTPLLATVMVIYTGITPYTVEGPLSKDVSRDSYTCKKSWWKTLLYINNFGDFFDSVSWDLENRHHIYRKTGLLLASMMLFCHLAANTFVIGFYDDWTHDKTKKYLNRIYSKPWTKAGPYAIGLLVGHILFHFNTDLKLRKMVYIPGWMMSTAAALTLVFVQDENFKDHHSLVPALTDRVKNLYEIIKAPLWSLCVGWVIFACHYGYGGCVNSILSWSGWVPLSRLTYSVYLCHLAVINYLNDIIMQEAAYTGMFILQRWISVTVISYLIGLGLTLLIECPIRNLMSWWRTSTGGVDGGDHRDRPSSQCVKE
ncbi:hypothetical protein Btru_001643 [Bulinus truncatus]|nr:hypothetical protein Btru_001643 [Bulinus truncatus]